MNSRIGKQLLVLFTAALFISACQTIDLFEKNTAIPAHEWATNFKPQFQFNISDTTSLYEVSLVLRHSDRYNYNNIIIRYNVETPDGKKYTFDAEKILGTNEKGWLGTGMDDIYEHRISLNKELAAAGVSLKNKGTYLFQLEQLMRENPLKNVFNVGIRIDKKR
jgi:gliding motility-associated lipoprotein GldH